MLKQVAAGVLVHESAFLQSNAVVVQGRDGVLLIDPGVHTSEMAALADELDQPVVAGFSTHPHWDHLLWHAGFGTATRFGTARCAATVRERLADPSFKTRLAQMVPPDIAAEMSLDLFGLLTGLPAGATHLPWDGPPIRIVEHRAHAPGHAALLIEESGVLVAGDMLSDILIPMLDLNGAADPAGDYLAALQLLEDAAGDADIVIPGHGSVGGSVRERIEQDRAYVRCLRDGGVTDDPRVGPAAAAPGLHERQQQHLSGA